jgi:hypothetical protein
MCLFPHNAPYLPQLENRIADFSAGKNDDIVDSINQALSFQPVDL